MISKNSGWVLKASDSRSVPFSGTMAATGLFRSVNRTISSPRSAAYSAKDRDACDNLMVFTVRELNFNGGEDRGLLARCQNLKMCLDRFGELDLVRHAASSTCFHSRILGAAS